MAFGTKYRCEFSDILLTDWKIDFQVDPDPGSITTLQASGNPMIIEWYGEDDIFEGHIMGSKMTLNVECLTDFAYSDLFTSDTLSIKVLVYHGNTLYWTGYVLANNYQEPYDNTPYGITIAATDSLGLLKDYNFKDLGYTVRQTKAKVIYDILNTVGITTWTEYVNLYESTMDSGTGDSMMDQCGVEPLLWKDKTYYDALEAILNSLNAGIRQDNGVFEIFRYKELADTTMYGRTFTSATVKSSTTKTPAQSINRPGTASDLIDTEGGTMMLMPQYKTVYANQDYATSESILKNYDFPYAEFSGSGLEWTIPYWTENGSTVMLPLCSTKETKEQTGVWINNDAAGITYYIEQDLSVYTSTEDMIVEVDAGAWGTGSGTLVVQILCTDGIYTKQYLYNFATKTGSWVTVEEGYYQELVNGASFSGGFSTSVYKYKLDGLPYTGTLIVCLYNAVSGANTLYSVFKSVKIYSLNSSGILPEGVGYTITNGTSGIIVDKEYTLGDGCGFANDHLQFYGALNVWESGDIKPTSLSWHTRGVTENLPMINITGTEWANQYARPKQIIDLPLIENTAATFLKLNGNLQDSLNTYSGNNRKFAISRAIYDVAQRQYDLTLTELL